VKVDSREGREREPFCILMELRYFVYCSLERLTRLILNEFLCAQRRILLRRGWLFRLGRIERVYDERTTTRR
jgi:hypothetical protein